MRKFISYPLFSLLLVWVTVAFSQEVVSQFELNPGYEMRLVDQSEEPIFLLDNSKQFRLVYLDKQLQHKKTLPIAKASSRLYYMDIKATYKRDETIHVLIQGEHDPTWYMLNIDEKTQTSTLIKPDEFLPTDIKVGDFVNLNYFVEDHRFYLFQVIEDQAEREKLRIYEIDDANTYIFNDYSLPIADLFKQFKRQQWVLPNMTDVFDVSTPSSACPIKLYVSPNKFTITAEGSKEDGQFTNVFSIDRHDWTITQNTYEYPVNLPKKPRRQFNSFLYKDYLFQALVNEGGLHIFQKEMKGGKIIHQHSFGSEKVLHAFFNTPFRQVYRNNKWKSVYTANMLNNLYGETEGFAQKHLGVFIRSIGPEVDRITVGTHMFTNRGVEQGLQIAGVFIQFSGFGLTRLSIGPNINLYVNPMSFYQPFQQSMSTTHQLVRTQDAIYYMETNIHLDSFTLTEIVGPHNVFLDIEAYKTESKLNKKTWGITTMMSEDRFFLGYGRKKQYQFVQFDVSEEK